MKLTVLYRVENCEEIKDPSNAQLNVRLPLTEEDKLTDLPSHGLSANKTSDNFQPKIFVSVQAAYKELNESFNANSL